MIRLAERFWLKPFSNLSVFTFKAESDSGPSEFIRNFIRNSRPDPLRRDDQPPGWAARVTAQVQIGPGSVHASTSRQPFEFESSLTVTPAPEFFEKLSVLLLLLLVLLEEDVLGRLAGRHRVGTFHRSPVHNLFIDITFWIEVLATD